MSKYFLLIYLMAGAASAQTTYTYTYSGATLTVLNGGGMTPGFTSLSGTVTLAAPLDPNADNQTVTPIAYSMGGITVPLPALNGQQNSEISPLTFFIFSTENGTITAWSIYIEEGLDVGNCVICADVRVSTVGFQGLGADSYYSRGEKASCIVADCLYTANTLTIGAWTSPPDLPSAPPSPTLQAQLATAQAQVNTLEAKLATAQIEVASYLNGYIAEYVINQAEGACILKWRNGGKC